MIRLFCSSILTLALTACISPENSSPAEIEPSNPVIAERIEQRLSENREQPAPDVRDIPSKGPDLPSEEELAQERAAILAEQAALRQSLQGDLSADEEAVLAARAEELKAAIARDRALMEAEGRLSTKPRPTVDIEEN